MPTGRTATISVATYAWTTLHTTVSGVYKYRLCMALTWSDLNMIKRLWAAYC